MEKVLEKAIKKAKDIDKKRQGNEALGILSGIPLALTDDITTKGILTKAGSKMLEKYIPPFNASIIDRLYDEDSILLGKVKVEEFGLSPSKSVSEILDSKGALFGLGASMDSNRYSMKGTFGLISRYGLIGPTSSFDQVIPITNCVEDLALVLNSVVGYDKRDSASLNKEKVDYRNSLTGDIKGFKIAVPTELTDDMEEIIKDLEGQGTVVDQVKISTLEYILPVYKVLASAEFASISARYDGISLGYRADLFEDIDELYKKTRSQGFSKEAKKAIMFGNYAISSGQYESLYKQAQKVRGMIKEEFTKIIGEYGLIILPHGVKEDYDIVANVTGLPAITIPNGIQLIGPYLGEEDLIRLAYTIESQGGRK